MSQTTEPKRAIGDFLGILRCLSFIEDVDSFNKWIQSYHSIDISNIFLSGYKLLFDTLVRMLIDNIEINESLALTTDEIFSRASFRGISIFKLPNTCEKTIMIKNIALLARKISDIHNWQDLKDGLESFNKNVIEDLQSVHDISSYNTKFRIPNMDTAINYSSMFQVYIFLNDTSRGLPHGYSSAMLEDVSASLDFRFRVSNNLSSDVFVGYKYAVQYLWFCLLGTNFNNSVVANLHQTSNWTSFDEYFDLIQKKIINPIEEAAGGVAAFNYYIFVKDNARFVSKKLLEPIQREVVLSQTEVLQQTFLWYPVQFIDSTDFSFSGVPALIPLLMGLIQIKRRKVEKSKTRVVRVIHKEPDAHRRDYSYAVLTELTGYISDASGWLLFYDCCSDRGSTSKLFEETEKLLWRYEQSDFIEVATITLEKNKLVPFVRKES